MRRALVTGGCGFLGSWIVRMLVEEGVAVRVLALPGEPRDGIAGLDVDVVEGNVLRVADCRRAVEGVDTVFHAAAVYQDWAPDPTQMYGVNLGGTFHVLEAARRVGVERVVYTASVVSIGRPDPGTTGDEHTPYDAWQLDFPYSRSKYFGRELAERFAEWGDDVRVVCPGVVFGPGDFRPTPSGKIIINSLQGGPAVHFQGGMSYVDVRDAARVHVLVAQKGRPGERYIASAHNLTNRELVEIIDRALGRKRQLVKLPVPAARAIAIAMEQRAKRTGEPPMLARDFFEYALRPSFYTNRKAVEELGATFRPIDETIRDAVSFFRERGMA